MNRLNSLDWEFARHIELTVSRGNFKDGEEAFQEISYKRGIGNLLKELERTEGIPIIDWVSFLEWHKDGFPHWHLFIEVESKGRSGMIGHERIKRRWPFGVVIWESPIKSEDHWKHIKGYFERYGYFGEGKGHQSKLPEWAMKRKKRIKRFESMKGEKGITRMYQDKRSSLGQWYKIGEKGDGKKKKERRSYELIISECGDKTRIEIIDNSFTNSFTVEVKYSEIKDWCRFPYIKGKGLVGNLLKNEMEEFISELRKKESDNKIRKHNKLVAAVLKEFQGEVVTVSGNLTPPP